jgi:hypothetical protein
MKRHKAPTREKLLVISVDALGRDFDFGHRGFTWYLAGPFRGLLHDVADSIGNRCVKHHNFGLGASQIHTHKLARLQHCLSKANGLPAGSEIQAVFPI